MKLFTAICQRLQRALGKPTAPIEAVPNQPLLAPEAESTASPLGKQIISADQHQLRLRDLDHNALKVVYQLQDGGYEGYLVGGCIRDLLLGLKPKDFDIATNAHPEEAHRLFKRSRLIGRRFKLLHVRFGRELIEVATFRASHDSQSNNSAGEHGKQNDSGLILRDNVYGTIEEDALRRDFTVNSFYYCVKDNSIYDFAGGYHDLQNKTLRMIGDPEARYREDPVRMLRAARFAAKLQFVIEPKTAEPIQRLAHLLRSIAPARLFDESLKVFQSGYGLSALAELEKHQLLSSLFPLTQQSMEDPQLGALTRELVTQALTNTDRRLRQGRSVTPAFLYAALLWYPMQKRMDRLMQDEQMPAIPALHEAANQVISEQVRHTAIPRRFSTPIREIWELQLRLPKRFGTRAAGLMEHPRFRAAYDLLLLREQAGEALNGLADWWTRYQSADMATREEMSNSLRNSRPANKRRRRPSQKRPPKSLQAGDE